MSPRIVVEAAIENGEQQKQYVVIVGTGAMYIDPILVIDDP